MKKFYTLAITLAAAPALMLAVCNQANAQRKNTTSHDVAPVDFTAVSDSASQNVNKNECNCGQDKKCLKKCKKLMKKDQKEDKKHKDKKDKKSHHKMMREQTEEINESYAKALRKIEKSSFSPEQKELLKQQAEQNRDWALQKMNEYQQLMQQQMQARQKLDMQALMKDKDNRKLVKRISEIPFED